ESTSDERADDRLHGPPPARGQPRAGSRPGAGQEAWRRQGWGRAGDGPGRGVHLLLRP
ncbi:MAG: Formate dehydrogenase O putative subunit, partial [uncultured Friedmanniella sp.]